MASSLAQCERDGKPPATQGGYGAVFYRIVLKARRSQHASGMVAWAGQRVFGEPRALRQRAYQGGKRPAACSEPQCHSEAPFADYARLCSETQ